MDGNINSEDLKMRGELNLKRSQEEELEYRRATNKEVKERVSEVVERLTQGESAYKISKDLAERFQISMPQARAYVTKAYKVLKEYNDCKREEAFEQSLATLQDIYERAKKDKDNKLMLEVTREINKVRGLYEASKINVNHTGSIELSFGDFNITEEEQ